MSDESDAISPSVRTEADRLADLGDVLTERQALAYVLRAVEGVPRQEAADMMGVAVSTLDTTYGRATRNLTDAAEVVEAVAELRDE